MRVKNVKLEYYAFYYSFNKHKLEWTNILGDRYKDEVYKDLRKGKIKNRNDLKQHLDRYLFYYYASKSEYEVMVGDLHIPSYYYECYCDNLIKIDIYHQVSLNIDTIVDYIISKMKIKFKED